MATVVRHEGESFDSLLKRFRQKVANARILTAAKKHRYFIPKSDLRQMAQRKAVRRERKRRWREDRGYSSA